MRVPRRARSLVLPLALGLAVAGCGPSGGGGKSAPAPAAPVQRIDPCTLLTAADAQAALGGPVGQLMMTSVLDDARNSSGDPAQCGYGLEDDPSRTVRLEVRPMADAARAQGALDSARSVLAASGVQDVPGLGDAAFWAGGAIHQLHLRQGSTGIVVTCDPGPGKDALAVAKTVAGRALGRLPQ
jgi:hypothetical protein